MLLAKVVEDIPAQALARAAVARHDAQPLIVALSKGLALGLAEFLAAAFNQILRGRDVAGREEEDAVRRGPVASGAPGLLVICLYALGHVVVYDEADVGLVYAHAEGVCRDHYALAVELEVLLIPPPLLLSEAGVIARRGKVASA